MMFKRLFSACRIAMQQKREVHEMMKPTQCTQNKDKKRLEIMEKPLKLPQNCKPPLLYPNELGTARNFACATHAKLDSLSL